MTNTLAHKELITLHRTMSHMTRYGRISARKTNGQYIVTVEDFEDATINRMTFKTLRGCLIAFNEAKGLI